MGAEMQGVLVVAEYPLWIRVIEGMVNDCPGLAVCGTATSAPRARELCMKLQPDVIVLDLELSSATGLGLVREFSRLRPGVRTLAMSERDEDDLWLLRIFQAGSCGFFSKRDLPHDLADGLSLLWRGERFLSRRVAHMMNERLIGGPQHPKSAARPTRLSPQEEMVLGHIRLGHGPKEIARALGVEVTTVETHRHRIKRKLGLRSCGELRAYAATCLERRNPREQKTSRR